MYSDNAFSMPADDGFRLYDYAVLVHLFQIGCPSHKLCPPQKSLDSRAWSVDASTAYA